MDTVVIEERTDIMISIKNIKSDEKTMSCNFYPENNKVIDKEIKEIVETDICEGCYMRTLDIQDDYSLLL